MALLREMPGTHIISGLKGKIDFYYWMGLAVARTWPRSPGHVRTPEVMAQWPAFITAAKEWNNLSPEVQESYRKLAQSSGLNGRDLQVRGYLAGLYRYEVP